MKKLIATAALSLACVSASAMNALTLVAALHGGPETGVAVGYVKGIADMGNGSIYCLPDGVNGYELQRLMVLSVPQGKGGPHPDLYDPALHFVVKVLIAAYPCKR